MGAGIAQVCAQSGYRVHLNDVKPEALDKAEKGLQWSVNKLAEKGFFQEDPDKILSRLSYETDLSCAADADWIIEAVLEVEALKIDLFKALEKKISRHNPAGHQHLLHTHYPYCRTSQPTRAYAGSSFFRTGTIHGARGGCERGADSRPCV